MSERLLLPLRQTSRPGDPVNLLCEGKYFSRLIAAFEYVLALGSGNCGDVHFWKIKANKVCLVPVEELIVLKLPH